jgi:hypothetical protein
MRPSRLLQVGLKMFWLQGFHGRRAYSLLACVCLAALVMQVSHPALHPLEVINPDTDADQACPLSHVAPALITARPCLLGTGLSIARLLDPLPRFSHFRFIHPLAARPPPA